MYHKYMNKINYDNDFISQSLVLSQRAYNYFQVACENMNGWHTVSSTPSPQLFSENITACANTMRELNKLAAQYTDDEKVSIDLAQSYLMIEKQIVQAVISMTKSKELFFTIEKILQNIVSQWTMVRKMQYEQNQALELDRKSNDKPDAQNISIDTTL